MLVLSRSLNESIVIDDTITIVVVDIRGDKVRLGVVHPRSSSVHRQEVWEAIQKATAEDKPAFGFTVSTSGDESLGLKQLCERYIKHQKIAEGKTQMQAAAAVLRSFKRAVAEELEKLEVV